MLDDGGCSSSFQSQSQWIGFSIHFLLRYATQKTLELTVRKYTDTSLRVKFLKRSGRNFVSRSVKKNTRFSIQFLLRCTSQKSLKVTGDSRRHSGLKVS